MIIAKTWVNLATIGFTAIEVLDVYLATLNSCKKTLFSETILIKVH